MTQAEKIARVATALTEYREKLPEHPADRYVHELKLAKKYNIDKRVMRQAVHLLVERMGV